MSSDAPPAEVALCAENLGKCYQLYARPQDRLKQTLWRGRRQFYREFWALRNVSFTLQRGESLGVIGRNGSGKSTLLQVLSGVLAPSEGKVRVSGRVTALLELGSGFNPEFTGRENAFMNGAILGFSPAEMEARFDDIAAFADIGEFMEQPVRTYSSGMVVRLAFAVQAHLNPSVLIVDEALAVGDVQFQHKCMRRIKELLDRGVTFLFVSHSTETVKRFCRRGLWLDQGEMKYFGEAGAAAENYLSFMRMREAQAAPSDRAPPAAGAAVGGPAAVEAPSVRLADALPTVPSEIDLLDEQLFLQGNWDWVPCPGTPLFARRCGDANGLAGFRTSDREMILQFFRGPRATAARVTVDAVERLIELYDPAEPRIESYHFELGKGEHTVFIRPQEKGPNRGDELWWVGGRVTTPSPLPFRRDPKLGLNQADVKRYGSRKARITAVELLDYRTEQPVSQVAFGQRVRLRLHAERLQPAGPRLEFSFIVRDMNRIDLFGTTTCDEHVRLDPAACRFTVEFAFDVRLGPGSYSILAAFVECSEDMAQKLSMDHIDTACVFNVSFSSARPVWYVFHQPVAVRAEVGSAE